MLLHQKVLIPALRGLPVQITLARFIFADDELGFFRGVLFSRIDHVQTFRVDKFSRMSKSKISRILIFNIPRMLNF